MEPGNADTYTNIIQSSITSACSHCLVSCDIYYSRSLHFPKSATLALPSAEKLSVRTGVIILLGSEAMHSTKTYQDILRPPSPHQATHQDAVAGNVSLALIKSFQHQGPPASQTSQKIFSIHILTSILKRIWEGLWARPSEFVIDVKGNVVTCWVAFQAADNLRCIAASVQHWIDQFIQEELRVPYHEA